MFCETAFCGVSATEGVFCTQEDYNLYITDNVCLSVLLNTCSEWYDK